MNVLIRLVRNWISFDFPRYWPLGVFKFSLATSGLVFLIVLACILLFVLTLKLVHHEKSGLLVITALGFGLILLTNSLHGINDGFRIPIYGIEKKDFSGSYYATAREITDSRDFITHFVHNQKSFSNHSRTHPPGATLVIYWLDKWTKNPVLCAILLALISTFFSALFFYKILQRYYPQAVCKKTLLLFLLLPAVQVYFLASIDGLMTAVFLGVFYFFSREDSLLSVVLAALFLLLSSLLTFAFSFILPVLFFYRLSKPYLKKFVFTLILFVLMLLGFNALFNYDYLASFHLASQMENPGGFMLFSEPVSWLFTRIENIGEILLFLTPILIWVLVQPLTRKRLFDAKDGLEPAAFAAVATLLLMFLAGVWKTGETARACVFIYPFLLVPVANFFREETNRHACALICSLVFGQSLLMQLVGNYFW